MSFRNKKIIVAGGAGFIGSHFVEEAVKKGAKVLVLDNLHRGSLQNLKKVKKNIVFKKVDLRNEQKLTTLFNGYEYMVNFSALNTGVDYDLGRTQVMFEENMLLQMTPLRVAARTPSMKRFLQISSASVYSREAMEKIVPTPESADTCHPEPSKLGYALAKKMGENLASWYSENSKLRTVSARLINVYGGRDHFDEMGHFIPVMTRKMIQAKRKLSVFGSGKQKRSFIHVSDVVQALLLLLEKGENGGVYNVDSQDEKSVKQVVQNIQKILGKENLQIIYDKTKPEGSQRRMLDNTKIQDLGWQPQISFEDGLNETVIEIQKRLKKYRK